MSHVIVHLFLTEFSVRPGSTFEISHHLQEEKLLRKLDCCEDGEEEEQIVEM